MAKFRLVADAHFEAEDWQDALAKLQEHFLAHLCIQQNGSSEGYKTVEQTGYIRLDALNEVMRLDQ